ncbi:MAG: PIG-L family deacetylase [Actinomycetota bacterium]|nr:PIG-L family deacetylase [Actinomycetota bacterium]MDA8209921.1 PIG-L family deacetylase [Actinomycetota bacterium]
MRIMAETPSRALCVFAHPDDADVGAGGTIARWSRGGCEVRLVVAARGEKGTTDPDTDPESLAAARAAELATAAAELGVASVEVLGYGDGEVENTYELRERLVAMVREFRPEVVLSHDPSALFFGATYFNHRDHRELGFAVLDAVFPASHLPLYFPAAGPPYRVPVVLLSGTLEGQVAVDVSATLESKKRAVAAHSSQVGRRGREVESSIEATARGLGRRAGLYAAEVFREMRNEAGER